MEEIQKKDQTQNWLYAVIALLLLALVIETGFLISKNNQSRTETKDKRPKILQPTYPQGTPQMSQPRRTPLHASSWRFRRDWDDWDPFAEMERMQEEMNRLFDESFGRALRNFSGIGSFAGAGTPPAMGFFHTFDFPSFSPSIELQETPKAYIAKVDLPGLEKDKIDVNVSGNTLTIRGERKEEVEKEDARQGIYASERSYGSFYRTLPLPGPVDETKVTADYKDGVLTVTLPKLEGTQSSKKKIQIT